MDVFKLFEVNKVVLRELQLLDRDNYLVVDFVCVFESSNNIVLMIVNFLDSFFSNVGFDVVIVKVVSERVEVLVLVVEI